jgi:hypothetical protein
VLHEIRCHERLVELCSQVYEAFLSTPRFSALLPAPSEQPSLSRHSPPRRPPPARLDAA